MLVELKQKRSKQLNCNLAHVHMQIGIIGGSGLYDMAELTDREERRSTTPFGEPSAPYVLGTLRGKRVAFLARHGVGHRLHAVGAELPRQHLRLQDARRRGILSASAVGSLKEEYRPLDLVVPDQFFDRTQRPRSHVLRRAAWSRTSASRIRSARR